MVVSLGFTFYKIRCKVLNKFNVCWNNVYRIVFGMHKWESVKGVQWFCERLDCIRIIHSLNFTVVSAAPLTMLFHSVLIGFCIATSSKTCVESMM